MKNSTATSPEFYGRIAACVIFFLALIGIARAQDASSAIFPLPFDSRERIARPDMTGITRLRFLTTVDFPPFNFIDQNSKLTGFHIDLARAICGELDIADRCQVQAIAFADLTAALERKEGEAVLAGMAVSVDLRRRFAFSRPFMQLPARFVVRRNGVPEGRAAALAKKPVGVVARTAHEAMLRAYFPELQAVPFPSAPAAFAALKARRIEAVFGSGMQLSFWAASADAAGCCRLFDGPYFSEAFLGEGLTVMLRKEDKVLVEAIDHALLALSRNGRLAEIYLRYFPNGIY
ncbi:transporter substrate-binding domain-containing protein [Rhizobium sp. TRM95111]|uniref:transporter substrate-binding domain-containing protein n=1 Tax=Rhizobium alarense TaxID=2846851 RepID=UPI001F1BD58E|nr:transporter substrate-binding domain-containing protein [Rhizobium alarense]MCF3641979.1 transporter substrate-binding domain-containing protein [Rhizobium alarense]